MKLLESGEMYLETILILNRKNPNVRATDIADYMNFSKPSVSRALGLLRGDNYITVDADTGHIALTEKGMAVAESIYDRHTVLTGFLAGIGVSPEIASEDACKIEHVISETSFARIKEFIKNHDGK